MGKECGAWVSRRLWGGGNTSPLKTTAWEATRTRTNDKLNLLRPSSHVFIPRTKWLEVASFLGSLLFPSHGRGEALRMRVGGIVHANAKLWHRRWKSNITVCH